MKLTGQHKQVYDYLKAHGKATIREIRNNTFPSVQKPCMRCSEINRRSVEELGYELIVNSGKNKSREVYKTIAKPLTKSVPTYHFDEERGVMVEKFETVEV